jgi:hypothetical protein
MIGVNDSEVYFSDTTLTVGNQRWQVSYPILYAFIANNRVIVLYDPDSYTEKFGQFPNLVAFSFDGEQLWKAELPTHQSGDRYYDVKYSLDVGLEASSVWSYSCKIDESNGKIKSKVFYK